MLDWAVLVTFLLFIVTSILSTWRIPKQWKWADEIAYEIMKDNISKASFLIHVLGDNQEKVIVLFRDRAFLNLGDTILDIMALIFAPISLIGFWRFRLIKARYDAKTLSRLDIISNSFLLFCDVPWLLLLGVTLILAPWRFLTTFLKIARVQTHFPDN
jgi:hypothetical protein